jgi:Glutamine amidotransferases class-II
MCLAIVKKANATLDPEEMKEASISNPHGFGVAWTDGKRLRCFKTMKKTELFDRLKKIVAYPAIVHFRFATHGTKSVENCHPFRINKSTAMIHNGIIDIKCHDATRSDTWHFVEDVVKPLEAMSRGQFISSPEGQEMMAKYIGSGSKLCFLNWKGEIVIVNESAGHWRDNVWYSNCSYSKRSVVSIPAQPYSAYDDDDYYDYNPTWFTHSYRKNKRKTWKESSPAKMGQIQRELYATPEDQQLAEQAEKMIEEQAIKEYEANKFHQTEGGTL